MNKRKKLILICIIETLIVLFIIFLFLKFDIYVLKVTDLYENNNISTISNDNSLPNFVPSVAFYNIYGQQVNKLYGDN